jgi:hypothetical protein
MDWRESLIFSNSWKAACARCVHREIKENPAPDSIAEGRGAPRLGDYPQYSPEHFLSIRVRIFRDEHGAMHILLGNWKNAVAHPAWRKRVCRKTAGFRSALVLFPGGDFNRRALCVERIDLLKHRPTPPLETFSVVYVAQPANQVQVHYGENAWRKAFRRRLVLEPIQNYVNPIALAFQVNYLIELYAAHLHLT